MNNLINLSTHVYANAYIYDGLRTTKHFFRFTVDTADMKVDDIQYTREDYALYFTLTKRPYHADNREGFYFFKLRKQKVYFRLLKGAENATDTSRRRKRSDYL